MRPHHRAVLDRLRDPLPRHRVDPRGLAREEQRPLRERAVHLDAALGEALVLVLRDVESHRREALAELLAEVEIAVLVSDLEVVDAAADELLATHDCRKVPRVPGELAIARVEVNHAALAIAGDALGVELEHLRAQRACAQTERLAHHAADAVAPDDDARFEATRRRLDDGSVSAGLDALDLGVLDD